MAADDLDAPLGQEPGRRKRTAVPAVVPQAVAGLLGLFVLVFLVWAVVADDPLGGEPAAVISALPQMSAPAQQTASAAPAPSVGPKRYDGPEPAAPASGGSQTVTIIDGSSGKRQEVVVPGSGEQKGSVDKRLMENSRHGPIPRISAEGVRPAEAYAARPPAAQQATGGARIAVIVGGLGVGASATADALSKLPAAVTLAFTPYGGDLEGQVARARAKGHEILLHVPMEPFDYPDNDPGPQTLLSSLSPEQNIDRLQWLMSRFQGYVGIANYMGARFTASEAAIAPVLREAAKRGLLYVDDGSSARSLTSQIAGANNLAFARADVVIDAVPTPADIDKALARIEALARERGTAVAYGGALPVTLDRIARWSKAAAARGIRLVPVSAAVARARSS